jgi:hypothetical protein
MASNNLIVQNVSKLAVSDDFLSDGRHERIILIYLEGTEQPALQITLRSHIMKKEEIVLERK